MEEERRLCYVAMTRAKEKLYLTCANQRMLFGRTSSNRPSRFVDEIPTEHLERSGRTFLDPGVGDWGGIPSRTSGYGGYQRGEQSYGGYAARGSEAPQRPAPPSYGGFTRAMGGRTGGVYPAAPAAGRPQRPLGCRPAAAAVPAALPTFQKGDMVRHKAFGQGMILSVQKMGGDALVEIAFDNVGTKRLMLKSAAAHMEKI